MKRSTFLTLVGGLGLVIGLLALFAPSVMLAGKGVTSDPANVWMREVGVLILALAVMVLLVRRAPDSSSLRALFWGNALVHIGLFPIEILAWRAGLITRLAGIVPNSVFHVVVATGFIVFASRM